MDYYFYCIDFCYDTDTDSDSDDEDNNFGRDYDGTY